MESTSAANFSTAAAIALAGLLLIGAQSDAGARPIRSVIAVASDGGTQRTVPVDRPAAGPLRVLFAGDSLTYGVAASAPAGGFRPVLVEILAADGPVEEFHTERAGAGVGTVANLLDVPARLDLAVVELGTNNVGAGVPVADFRATYAALLDKIHDTSPDAPLLCVGTWGSDGNGFGSDPYNAVIHAECANRGGVFVSIADLYGVPGNRGPSGLPAVGGPSDTFHPNDQGHRAIAELLGDRITIR